MTVRPNRELRGCVKDLDVDKDKGGGVGLYFAYMLVGHLNRDISRETLESR